MKAIASKRRRFGYRRIGVLLEREGMIMNHKKLYRIYTEENQGVRRQRGRTRAQGSRTAMPLGLRPGERWYLDFVSDTFGASRKFRMLAVNDDGCRENLCLMADTSISGARVGDTTTIRSDRTRLSGTKRPLKRAERLSNLKAPRTTRLPKLTMKNMESKPANFRYE